MVLEGTLSVGNDAAVGTATLSLNDGSAIQASGGPHRIGNPVDLFNSGLGEFGVVSSSVTVLGGNDLTLIGSITQSSRVSGSLVKTGTGNLTLFGTNTYSGGTTLSAGTLTVANNAALGTGLLTFNNGILQAAVPVTLANAFTVGGAATIGGSNILTLGGAGTLTAGNALTVVNSATTTLSGVLGGAGNLVEAAGMLVLSGNNAYTGTTTLTSGTMVVGSNTALGTGTLILNGGSIQSSVNVTLANPFTVGGSTTVAGSNSITFTGPGGLGNGTAMIVNNSGITTLGGVVGGAGGLTTVIGAGTLILSVADSYMGRTTINSGILLVEANNAVPSTSAVMVGSGGTFALNGFDDTIGSLEGAGSVVLGSADIPSLLTTNVNNMSTMFSGVIRASGGLIKMGMGTLTLSMGPDTYSGATTVAAGTLLVNDNQPSSDVTVDTGATLGGSGTVGAVTATGNVSPGGPNSTDTASLRAASATFNIGGSFVVKLNGAMPASQYDQLNSTGTVDLTGTPTLSVSVSFQVPLGTSFTIITASAVIGNFARLPNNAVLVAGGQAFVITYNGTSVVLTRGPGGTNTTLAAFANSSYPGQPVSFTATVTAAVRGDVAPTGTVQFQIGGRNVGSPVPLTGRAGTATATMTIPVSSVDDQTVAALYSGDSNFKTSTASLDPDKFFVTKLYGDLLIRSPDDGGLQTWLGQLHKGVSRTQVAMDFWVSREHRGLEVDQFYSAIFHRDARLDQVGRQHWVDQLLAGVPEFQVALALVASPEYMAEHLNDSSYVTGLYRALLSRDGTTMEVSDWLQTLHNGARRDVVAYSFLSSPEAYRDAIDFCYLNYLDRQETPQEQKTWFLVLQSGRATPLLKGERPTPLSLASAFLGWDEYLARALNGAMSSSTDNDSAGLE
jgi:autotransporter-associated beta strand protein